MYKAQTESLESLQVTLQQNPDSLTFARVADALLKAGRIDEAIQVCEEGVRRHPYYVTGHMVLGKGYMKKTDFLQAEKEFKRVLLYDPKYLAAHRHFGDLMREIGWENTCEMSYRKILSIDPLDEKVHGIVDEFDRKAEEGKSEQPQPVKEAADTRELRKPSPPREAPVASVPLSTDELLEAAGSGKQEAPAKSSPPPSPKPGETGGVFPKADERSEPSPLTKNDEARFSSILDDIFQDEVIDEGFSPSPSYPPDEIEPYESRRGFDDDLDSDHLPWRPEPRETKSEPKPEPKHDSSLEARREAEKTEPELKPRQPSRIPTTPVDFDFDFDDTSAAGVKKQSAVELARPRSSESLPARPVENLPSRPAERMPSPRVLPAREEPAVLPAPRLPAREESSIPLPFSDSTPRDKIVTPTLGEIYAAQGQYAKAIGVFELLSKKDPTNRHFREKIEYLKKRLQEIQNAG